MINLCSGPPQHPSDLKTDKLKQTDMFIIILSWKAPSSPSMVQLNYTVSVININTGVVQSFTTSNTTYITLTREDFEGDGECDEYVWSVTSLNPAGASDPVNYSTHLILFSG